MAERLPTRRTHKSPSYPLHGKNMSEDLFYETVRINSKLAQYHVDGYYQNAVPGAQTNAILTRLGGAAPEAWYAPRDGNVMTIWVAVDSPWTAGALQVFIFKNGNKMANLSAQLDSANVSYKASSVGRGQVPFNAGDKLDIRVTTAGWTPTTANLRAGMEVEV